MKNVLVSGLAVAALAVMTAPASLAQTTLVGTIPFSFGINNHTVLPAGSYAVVRLGTYWQFRGKDAKAGAVVSGIPKYSNRNDDAKLVFECRADHCELREIQLGGGLAGYYVPQRHKSDPELARVVVVKLGRAAAD